MKASYWLVLGIVAAAALYAVILSWFLQRRARKMLLSPVSDPPVATSIWTRNLLGGQVGHLIAVYLLSPALLAIGLLDVLTRQARYKSFRYTGLDAEMIGAGEIGIALIVLARYILPQVGTSRVSVVLFWVGFGLFAGGFSIALFRNI